LRNKRLSFKSTPQDVVSELGSPNRVFYKEVDKMRIHASGDSSKLVDTISGTGCADYFYNYFDLGIDILFDAQKHRIRKFVLHTNFPGHIDFNQYMKCNFHVSSQSILLSLRNNRFSTESEPEVPLHDSRTENESPQDQNSLIESEEEIVDETVVQSGQDDHLEESQDNVNNELSTEGSIHLEDNDNIINSTLQMNNENINSNNVDVPLSSPRMPDNDRKDDRFVGPDMKWSEIRDVIGVQVEKPVIYNRSSNTNPFGSTYFYGFKGIIFEVMKNEHISSVTLYLDS